MTRHTELTSSKVIRRARHSATSITDTMDLFLSSRNETESFGKAIGRTLQGGEVLALIGELGAGKTTLVRGIAAGLQAPPSSVSSPSFVLIHEYRGRQPLIHADFYRLRTVAEAESIGLSEYLNDGSIIAVEWADRFEAQLPGDRLDIRMSHRSSSARKVTLTAHGSQSRALLTRIRHCWHPVRASTSAPQTKTGARRKAPHR